MFCACLGKEMMAVAQPLFVWLLAPMGLITLAAILFPPYLGAAFGWMDVRVASVLARPSRVYFGVAFALGSASAVLAVVGRATPSAAAWISGTTVATVAWRTRQKRLAAGYEMLPATREWLARRAARRSRSYAGGLSLLAIAPILFFAGTLRLLASYPDELAALRARIKSGDLFACGSIDAGPIASAYRWAFAPFKEKLEDDCLDQAEELVSQLPVNGSTRDSVTALFLGYRWVFHDPDYRKRADDLLETPRTRDTGPIAAARDVMRAGFSDRVVCDVARSCLSSPCEPTPSARDLEWLLRVCTPTP
jgi:hypothetical protein